VTCIEDLREKREELNRSLLKDEEEKAKIQKELSSLTERLSRLNEDLARKMQVRGGFETVESLISARINIIAAHVFFSRPGRRRKCSTILRVLNIS
jgi:Sjoegren syndrome nuclear autoantigen 1